MDLHRSSLPYAQWLTAACLAIAAGVHIAIAPEHLHEAPYAGVLFLLLATAALASAGVLLTTNHPLAWASAAALSLAALVAYALSRSVGLPMLGDDVGDWVNPLGLVAVASETAVLLIAAHAQMSSGRYRIVTVTDRLYTVVPAGGEAPTAG
jgi:hypothetical protein